jgi:alkylhydroperoxidase/carboxymuconolactone decarboxylase family protein YurZ
MNDQTATPILDTLTAMTAASLIESGLDPGSLMLVRLAALIAVDAPAESYLLNIGPAAEAGLTVESAQAVLVTVAPIVGAPRVLSAVQRIVQALGVAIAVDEALLSAAANEAAESRGEQTAPKGSGG